MKDGGPAFPRNWDDGSSTGHLLRHDGMSLRDYFAAKAMQAFTAEVISMTVSLKKQGVLKSLIEDIPDAAYSIADSMIEGREK